MESVVHIFGIRHHGPGSSRSLLRSLGALQPDIVLVEGPPEADHLISLTSLPSMRPPVAILVYVPDQPQEAVFYPFALFSPEWSAVRYSQEQSIPFRFMDLPQSFRLGQPDAEAFPAYTNIHPFRADPLGALAEAAGYTDGERWWESMVEHRQGDADVFLAILEAMTALRAESGEDPDIVERRREAYMRRTIRKAKADGFQRIAVVCGAWHAPALIGLSGAAADNALLNGLPKAKVAATWAPWTHSRLSYRSGYGAGIESPGWYSHLWSSQGDITTRWMTKVSRLLREHDLDSSPAQVIEAVRLAETLATLRGRALPGLKEMNDSVQTVFCFGSNLPLRLIEEQLIIGDILGSVPEETPMTPLQADMERRQKTLRLAPEAGSRTIDFDLRKGNDLARSHFLHRLNLLTIPWGVPERSMRTKGTFHEAWRLQWRPEFAVAIIESAVWGNTVLDAAEARARNASDRATDLASLCSLLANVLLADLPNAVRHLMPRLQSASALTSDIAELMDAFPPLVNIARYGNVRNTDVGLVSHIVDGLATRISVGLPAACLSLDTNAANAMYRRVVACHSALSLFQNAGHLREWYGALSQLSKSTTIHGLIVGRACRILFDAAIQTKDDSATSMRLALGLTSDSTRSADWIEGFLNNSGQLLVLDDTLREIVDDWVCALTDDDFTSLLPLLRRTFSTFTSPERKQIGERIKLGRSLESSIDEENRYDYALGDQTLPLLIQLLGIDSEAVKT